jgi:hypothetical protein
VDESGFAAAVKIRAAVVRTKGKGKTEIPQGTGYLRV